MTSRPGWVRKVMRQVSSAIHTGGRAKWRVWADGTAAPFHDDGREAEFLPPARLLEHYDGNPMDLLKR
jgi:hypothetical protein